MKKIRAFAVLGALLCAGAVSAQTAPTSSAATAPAAVPTSRLDDILARGTLRACTTGDYKPYSFLRPDGQFEGIDIDMTNSLAKSLGVKAEFVKTSWSGLMNDFIAKCDVAVGGVSTTLDRQRRAFFTQPYQIDGKAPIARCDDVAKFQTVAQIDEPSTRVIVNPGGTNERFAKQYFPHATLTVYPDNVTIFKQILAGKADVMVTDASETLLQQKLNPGLCSVHPDKPFQYGEKAWLVPRGDVVFQQYVDQWLHLLQATGEYQAISDKWLK
ncbi:transporter substrate-binding domain-containing protein [Paraburkholderia megapolitana]|uniref:Cyclohexadienyl dehydratase n=1 Tax=Paraburkholderia megapolitana TaxID=420953 RepID=A0A1I3S8B5_9BURK|nr:transporter substrate-binding domain-containing protein [Paraburkholderia megapolitana]QDQ85819.1 transporter substrate-binding domain-containing protein [Paraburkholderia megapolitana]SFJ54935.1 cyclohexadienyl dehydratase [Paraburkholderia megapolitana]